MDVQLNRQGGRSQYSPAQHAQALDLGMTPRQVQDRLKAGLLVPVHRGVYRVAGGTVCPGQDLLAACMAAGGGAVASHRSAAALWKLRGIEASNSGIAVPRTACPELRSVVVHRTDRRLVGFSLLTGTLERLGGRGRRGAAVLRELVEERDPATAPTQSVLEDDLLCVLGRGGLPEPVRRYEMGGVLLAHGWRVLHFTWGDIRRRPAYVLEAVARELVLACPA